MRLQKLMPLGAAVIVAFSLLTALAAHQFVVLPQLYELQAQADRKDLRRALLAIDSKKLQLATLVYQTAIDDRTYALLQKPALSCTPSTTDLTMGNFHVDLVALFDRDNHLVAQRSAAEKDSLFHDNALPIADLQPLLIDLSTVKASAPLFDTGFALTANGPILYAVASVMRSDTSGTSNGNLVLATGFDREMRREIEEASQLNLQFMAPDATDLQAPPQAADSVYRNASDQLLWLIRNEQGRPIIKLVLALPPRDLDTNLLLPVQVSFAANLFCLFVLTLLFRNSLLKPMLAIDKHLHKVRAHGDYDLRLNNTSRNEIGDLSRNIDALVQHVQVQRDQLQAQTTEMHMLSFQDGLTGLANRRRFDQALADNWALAQRAHASLALIMFDADYFKNYNDHYGHQLGDAALKRLAEITRRVVVRQSDVAARYGGEEFAILLPDTSESAAEKIALRLQEELHKAAIPHQASHTGKLVTISVGVAALVPGTKNSHRDLVHRADAALYNSKACGRNCVTLASRLDTPLPGSA
jgi:diguanylate cyclase (GGDEF)-like protein